jgi:hypothetical protein
MASVRKSEVISEKFEVAGHCSSGTFANPYNLVIALDDSLIIKFWRKIVINPSRTFYRQITLSYSIPPAWEVRKVVMIYVKREVKLSLYIII